MPNEMENAFAELDRAFRNLYAGTITDKYRGTVVFEKIPIKDFSHEMFYGIWPESLNMETVESGLP